MCSPSELAAQRMPPPPTRTIFVDLLGIAIPEVPLHRWKRFQMRLAASDVLTGHDAGLKVPQKSPK